MDEIRHRLIRTYEIAGRQDAKYRVEVWKDLEARRFWPRVYFMADGAAGPTWIIDESSNWERMLHANEQAALDEVIELLQG